MNTACFVNVRNDRPTILAGQCLIGFGLTDAVDEDAHRFVGRAANREVTIGGASLAPVLGREQVVQARPRR